MAGWVTLAVITALTLSAFSFYDMLRNLGWLLAYTVFFLGAAIYAYNPSKGLIGRRGGPGGGA